MRALALLLCAGLAHAQDGETERDEDAIFGQPAAAQTSDSESSDSESSDSESSDSESSDSESSDSVPELETTTSDAEIYALLAEADKRVTVGGLVLLRADVLVFDAQESDDAPASLSSDNLLDLYVDARPNDRLRAYVRGRLTHSLTTRAGDLDPFTDEELQQSQVALDQLWLNFDIARSVFVTAGRQRIKWGAGRLWNPTDFLQPARLDSLAYFDVRTGVGLVKVHLPVNPVNLYAIADIEGAGSLDQVGGAGRAEVVFGLTELAASVSARKDQPLKLGAQVTTGLWLFDLKAEAAFINGETSPGWEGGFDLGTLTIPTEVDRSEDWWVQALGGFELGARLNDEDTLYIGAEYFYNQLGFDDADLYPWLLAQGQLVPFYTGVHYVGAYLLLPGPGRGQPYNDMSWSASGIANLSDGTGVVRFDYSAVVLTELSLNAYAATYLGDQGEFHLRVEVPGALTGGDDMVLPASLVQAGLGLTLGF